MSAAKSQGCLLLTGATGFLGAQIARQLVGNPDLAIIALVRADDQDAAAQRLARAWWDWPELLNGRVEALAGDVCQPDLGLDAQKYARLAERVTHIIHAAADLRIDAPLAALRKTNLDGVTNMLALARSARRLERFTHVSTAYVAGRRSGAIAESSLSAADGFGSPYELSKYEGECLVQAAAGELPISIFRPGMIVGAAGTGEIRTFNTFYFPLRLYLSGRLPVLPAGPAQPVNIIPVDYVAESIARLTFDPRASGLTFHLTAPHESLPRAGELVDFVRAWARENLGLRLPRPLFLRLPLPARRYRFGQALAHRGQPTTAAHKPLLATLGRLQALLPYFNDRKQFQRKNLERLSTQPPPDWRAYLPRLLAFAVDQGFMHRTERTVHEQLLARLSSRRRPVHYYDIIQGRIIPRSAAGLRQEILAAAAALTALGIRPGERVAIVGLNSSRYLALDAAIGLVGAVSVPLYYTSPPAEIDHILSASGARLLLVGAPKILERLAEIQASLPVVSFWREPLPPGLSRPVMPWEAFLALAAGGPAPVRAPVGFGNLATLRYSSGTTGQPKGVSFQHRHLRWMGQTMAALLPWKARTRTARHLSFLPMNHVVEGILATYCPYYWPAPVEVYFLEDLKEIQQSLPRVRPTIFFSVPRIYERIWEALESNPLGRRYLSLPGGWLKSALAALLRRQTLRKAGLDKGDQLIAGSAPCSEAMLRNFRQLGIQIHNAYGLTEAPLVTLNRLGANRLGTVGDALPQTEIRIAADGEVLVHGPQVMCGYFGLPGDDAAQPLHDGWLQTGDLGLLQPDGSLVLTGRKKELIKTSYGKYVQPAKVEARLREIPGVAEAMLVGEGRPYCVALLWVKDHLLKIEAGRQIDRLICQLNRSLSHPEQVRRWAVLVNDLSIETGDLTANLKLKRQAVARRLETVLAGLYDGFSPMPAVLHVGEAGRE